MSGAAAVGSSTKKTLLLTAAPAPDTSLVLFAWSLRAIFMRVPGWRNGRRCGLKIRCPKGRAGSTPALGTT